VNRHSLIYPTLLFLFIRIAFAADDDTQLSKSIISQNLHPAKIIKILYQDVQGIGKKDSVVYYVKENLKKEGYGPPNLCGVAVFNGQNKLLWNQEKPCWDLGGGELPDFVYLDQINPTLPFIVLIPCQNASIGCGFNLFRWDGYSFREVPIFGNNIDGGNCSLKTMPDGRQVIITSYRGQGVPTLLAYEAGKVYDHGPAYPDYYSDYIQDAKDAMDSTTMDDSEKLSKLTDGFIAAWDSRKVKDGMSFCRKILELENNQPVRGFDNISAREVHAYMGRFFMEIGYQDQAMKEFAASVGAYRFRPFNEEAGMYNELGAYYISKLEFSKAIEAFEKERPVLKKEDQSMRSPVYIERLDHELLWLKDQQALFATSSN
jgi:hypothetical protein